MNFTVKLSRDDASRDVALVHDKLTKEDQRRALMRVVGIRAEGELTRWFRYRDRTNPNKKGWHRQHFWEKLIGDTAFDASKTNANQAVVVVSNPALAAKIQGATIHATGAISSATGKATQNIAIPMQAAAYGHWPRSKEIPGLFFIKKKGGLGGFLVARDGKGLIFFYRLLPEVVVPKDPQALPPADKIGQALGEAALQYFRRHGSGGING